jgi:hypothetical protein
MNYKDGHSLTTAWNNLIAFDRTKYIIEYNKLIRKKQQNNIDGRTEANRYKNRFRCGKFSVRE